MLSAPLADLFHSLNTLTEVMNVPKSFRLYIPDEFQQDVEWGKNQSHPNGFSRFLLELLHEARVKSEKTKPAENDEKMRNDVSDSNEAQEFYHSIFGFIREQNKDDRDFCGGSREKAAFAIKQLFLEVTKKKPEHYEYCKSVFEVEHSYLFRLWQDQH